MADLTVEIQDSDSYGCVLDHMHLVKEGVNECVALSGWELTGPGSLPPPASAALLQVQQVGSLQLQQERWPSVPEGLPVATVAPPRSPPRLIQPCACVLSKGDYFKSAYFRLSWVQVNLLAGHSEQETDWCGVAQKQPAELS